MEEMLVDREFPLTQPTASPYPEFEDDQESEESSADVSEEPASVETVSPSLSPAYEPQQLVSLSVGSKRYYHPLDDCEDASGISQTIVGEAKKLGYRLCPKCDERQKNPEVEVVEEE